MLAYVLPSRGVDELDGPSRDMVLSSALELVSMCFVPLFVRLFAGAVKEQTSQGSRSLPGLVSR